MLKIDRINLFFGRMPCDLHFSYGRVQAFPYCVAEITAGNCIGVGECLHPDEDDCVKLGRTLVGQDAFRLDRLIPRIEFDWQASVQRELYSMALHDLAAKTMGVPLYVMMGGLVRRRIPLMACIFPKSPEHAAGVASRFVAQGYQALKVKHFGKPDLDVAITKAVRAAFPTGYLQADTNCGYKSYTETAAMLPRLAKAGLDAVEDPGDLSLEEYGRLLTVAPRPKIILDAISRGDKAMGEIARLRPADAVNLHPNMQGTFSDIRDRAATARLAGLGVEIGGTGYTGVGSWAHLHVAAVFGEAYPYGELCGHIDHGMPVSTAAELMPIENGMAVVPDRPGHGGELNREYLARNAKLVELI